MSKFEVTVNHTEEFSCSSDDREEVTVEKAHCKEDEYLAETTTGAYVHTIPEKIGVIHYSNVCIFSMSKYFVKIKTKTHYEPETIVSKHCWIGQVSLA